MVDDVSDAYIHIHTYGGALGGQYGIYNSLTGEFSSYPTDRGDEAFEHFVRLLVLTGGEGRFDNGYVIQRFQEWLNKQPNKADLAELINLRELV